MLMVCPNEGKVALAKLAWQTETSEGLSFRVELYQSDTVLDDESTLTDFTLADFDGYEPVEFSPLSLPDPVIVDDVAVITATVPPIYECTGGSPQTVYGWLAIQTDSDKILVGQRFNTPRVMSTGSVEALDPFTLSLKTFVICP